MDYEETGLIDLLTADIKRLNDCLAKLDQANSRLVEANVRLQEVNARMVDAANRLREANAKLELSLAGLGEMNYLMAEYLEPTLANEEESRQGGIVVPIRERRRKKQPLVPVEQI